METYPLPHGRIPRRMWRFLAKLREKGPPLTNGFAADSGTTVSEVREDCVLGRSRRTESNPKWRLATLICPSFRNPHPLDALEFKPALHVCQTLSLRPHRTRPDGGCLGKTSDTPRSRGFGLREHVKAGSARFARESEGQPLGGRSHCGDRCGEANFRLDTNVSSAASHVR